MMALAIKVQNSSEIYNSQSDKNRFIIIGRVKSKVAKSGKV